MRHASIVAAAFALLALRPAAAQTAAPDGVPAEVGARVRVTPLRGARATGVVVGYRADTLLMRPFAAAPDTVAVPLAALRRIDVSLGSRRRVGRGALFGAGTGLLIGAGVGLVGGQVDDEQGYEDVVAMAGAVTGAAIGALVGAIYGARRVERWGPAALRGQPLRVGVTLPTATRGAALTVRLTR